MEEWLYLQITNGEHHSKIRIAEKISDGQEEKINFT